jgi:predicted amidophosphoribosyltransferase
MLHRSTNLLDQLLGLLFPDRCLSCQRSGALLCKACRARLLPYNEPLPWLPPMSTAYVAYAYEGPLRGIVHSLKYRGERRIATLLAELLVQALEPSAFAADAIVARRTRLQSKRANRARRGAAVAAAAAHAGVDTHAIRALTSGLEQRRAPRKRCRSILLAAFHAAAAPCLAARRYSYYRCNLASLCKRATRGRQPADQRCSDCA